MSREASAAAVRAIIRRRLLELRSECEEAASELLPRATSSAGLFDLSDCFDRMQADVATLRERFEELVQRHAAELPGEVRR